VNFDFTEDQYALRDATREFLAGESSPAHVRAMWAHETGRSRGLWRQLAELGVIGLPVPEEHGGLGQDEVDLVLLLEEAGYAALPEPLLETTAIGVPLLVEAGTETQQKEWLPRIAEGEAVVTVQLADAPGGRGWVGGNPLVVDAHIADLLLLERCGELHALPRDRFAATAQPSMDGARRVFTVEVETSDATRMAGGIPEAARAYDRGAAGTAALLNGIGRRLLDMAVAYAKERQQFGRPIGSFQAIKHKLAETLLVVETSRAATWYAAYAIASDAPDLSAAASVAKSYASDAEAKANVEALQVHGGIGFTWEHDLHLWLKRGKALEQAYGSATAHRARLAPALFG
jgi:alkylation response protein AidB-like acyl-CoA dehydrogenase